MSKMSTAIEVVQSNPNCTIDEFISKCAARGVTFKSRDNAHARKSQARRAAGCDMSAIGRGAKTVATNGNGKQKAAPIAVASQVMANGRSEWVATAPPTLFSPFTAGSLTIDDIKAIKALGIDKAEVRNVCAIVRKIGVDLLEAAVDIL